MPKKTKRNIKRIKILPISIVFSLALSGIISGCDTINNFSIGYIDGDIKTKGTQAAIVEVVKNSEEKLYIPAGSLAIRDSKGNISTISATGEPIENVILGDESEFISEQKLSYMHLLECNTVYKINAKGGTTINSKEKEGSKELIELLNDEFVIGSPKNNEEYTKVIYFSNIKGVISGYIKSKDLEKIDTLKKEESSVFLEENEKQVLTSDSYLNLRDTPEINENNIIGKINSGEILSVIKDDSKTDEDRTWSYVRYYDKEKNESIIGYVASEYLINIEENNIEEKIKEETGIVYGIDSINIYGGEQIEGILNELNQKYNGTTENNKNFFIFRVGASGYGKNFDNIPIDQSDMDNILFCEKNNIPYGLYYYSTCITTEESQIEFDRINSNINKLKSYLNQNGISEMKNNIFPMAVDIEYAGEHDRHLASNKEDIAKSKAELCNMLKDEYGEPMLYIAPESIKTIMDYQTYLDNVNINKQKIWAVYPENASNSEQQIYDDFIEKIINSGSEVVIKQRRLGTKIFERNVDINEMSEEIYNKFVKDKEKEDNEFVKEKEDKKSNIIERIFGED